LLAVAEALRERIGSPLVPVEQERYERDVEAVRALLGDSAFDRARADGRALSPERAVDEALAEGR
jgi:hypothetical protein